MSARRIPNPRSVAVRAVIVAVLLGGCGSAATLQVPTGQFGGAAASPAAPAPGNLGARGVHIDTRDVALVSYNCRVAGQDPCRGLTDLTVTAKATSNVAGDGTRDAVLVVDGTDPGPAGDCRTVDEMDTFTFSIGTLQLRSLHRDCKTQGSWATAVPPTYSGPQVQTMFIVTGGTGAFSGAGGSGTEKGMNDDALTYEGTITYGDLSGR
jgi:hypothetical protein